MKKFLFIFALFALNATELGAQSNPGMVPQYSVPIGRGPGVVGFSSAAPGEAGNCLMSNGPSANPSFQTCNVVSVVSYGARCNAVEGVNGATGTDDFAAFQAAVTAVTAAGGGTIYVPKFGTNKCLWKKQSGANPSLALPSNITLQMDDSVRILVEGTPNGVNGYSDGAIRNSDMAVGNQNINVIGGAFKAAGPTHGSVFVAFRKCFNCKILTRGLDNNGSTRFQVSHSADIYARVYVGYENGTPWTKVLQPVQGMAITNVTNNGAGLIRVTVASTAGWPTGSRLSVSQVGGVTGANGNWTVTTVSATQFDLQGSTFSGTYTGGGYIGNLTAFEDGFRIGSGSYRVFLEGEINSGDDAIAINNEPSENPSNSTTGADIHDITINARVTTRNGNALRVYQEASMVAGNIYRIVVNSLVGKPERPLPGDSAIAITNFSAALNIADIAMFGVKLDASAVTGTHVIYLDRASTVSFYDTSFVASTTYAANIANSPYVSFINPNISGATQDNFIFSASNWGRIMGGLISGAGRDNVHVLNSDDFQIGGAILASPTRRNIGLVNAQRSIIFTNKHSSTSLQPIIQEDSGSNYSIVHQQQDAGVTTGIDTSAAGAQSQYDFFYGKTLTNVTLGGTIAGTPTFSGALTFNGALSVNAAVGVGGLLSANGGLSVGTGTMLSSSVSLTNGAGAATGTLTNAPAAGNPTKWLEVNDNGTVRRIPAW